MNEEDKIAWIDEENKIVSFHAIDDGKMIIKAESLFWDFLFGLTESGYDKKKLPEMLAYYAGRGCAVHKLSEVM